MDRLGKAAGLVSAIALMTCAAATPAAAGSFTTIAVPGADETQAVGINNAGEIVGYYVAGTNPILGANYYGFTDIGGSLNTFQVSTAQAPAVIAGGTLLYGISNNGGLGGSYVDGLGNQYGFVLYGGAFTTLNDPNADPAYGQTVVGLNDSGEAVGAYVNAAGVEQAFSWSSGTGYTNINTPAGTVFSTAGAVNDGGVIYGNYVDAAGNAHGFQQTPGGVFTTLDDPAHVGSSYINEGNNEGVLTGSWEDADGNYHPYVVINGTYDTLSLPSFVYSAQPWGINDRGQIVGFYNGGTLSFETSVPEPGAWTMMILGTGLAGGCLRRRRSLDPVRSFPG